MKIAIIQEWLVSVGGSDKVVKAIADIYPQAKIFTLVSDEKVCKNLGIDYARVTNSFIQRLPLGKKHYRMYLPIMPFAIEQFDLSEFDIVISSSHAVAKGVITKNTQLHICYCHSPIRYGWDLYHRYLEDGNLKFGLKGLLARYFLHKIRMWDVLSSFRVDHFISNSNYVGKRIAKIYRRESTTIYPNIDVSSFELCVNKEEFYLTSSRFVPYKKIDLIVEAFNEMPDKQLVVIGDGPDFEKVKKIAKGNVRLLGFQKFTVLKDYMQRAKAFVFAADEDFGMVPVEVQACGTPVIAYGVGGSRETVVEGLTGYFFYEQTKEAIIKEVLKFEVSNTKLDPRAIRMHAEKFSEERFKRELTEFVNQKYKLFKNS